MIIKHSPGEDKARLPGVMAAGIWHPYHCLPYHYLVTGESSSCIDPFFNMGAFEEALPYHFTKYILVGILSTHPRWKVGTVQTLDINIVWGTL